MIKAAITAEILRERLLYDPETGIFTRRINVAAFKAGSVAGTPDKDGYIQININYRLYFAHRLAFLYMTGEWPRYLVDHKNTKKNDNRWNNLREATDGQNKQNRRVHNKNNKSGLLGVSITQNGKGQAKIGVDGKTVCLGTFDTPELAHAAYWAAKEKLHPFQTVGLSDE